MANEKLQWIVETWFGDSRNSLVCKAILDDNISLEDFISGFDALRNAQMENDDDFIPSEFENVG